MSDSPGMSSPTQEAREAVKILYTNWRGETSVRSVVLPVALVRAPRFEANEWHPEPQWLLTLYDVEKRAERTFALAGIGAWGAEAVNKALAAQPAAPRLPTGYALVPINPTAAMLEAAAKADLRCNIDNLGADATAEDHWEAMVSAAPPPPAPEPSASERDDKERIVASLEAAITWIRRARTPPRLSVEQGE